MFIFIKISEGSVFLANPESRAVHFRLYLLEKFRDAGIEVQEGDVLDLVTTSVRRLVKTNDGHPLMNLRQLRHYSWVKDIVTDRDVYVPVLLKVNAMNDVGVS